MTKMLKSTFALVAAMAVSVTAGAVPASAALEIHIGGNGSNTENAVDFAHTNDTYVDQVNDTDINNKINISSNTGKNKANDNVSGDVVIDTGDTETAVSVTNEAGINHAEVEGCDCEFDAEVKIEGNGTDSENKAKFEVERVQEAFQDNKVDIVNDINADSVTGENKAKDNTGADVEIETGNSETIVLSSTTAGVNSLMLGSDDSAGAKLSAMIVENGSDSKNLLDVAHKVDTAIDQDNKTWVKNDVDTANNTGNNEAEDNTGDEVIIDTGNAATGIGIETMASFNVADVVDCGCALDGEIKIAGNGTESASEAEVELKDDLEVFQENDDDTINQVDGWLDTGNNEADDNTGDEYSDPAIYTGNADGVATVENVSGVNTFGAGFDIDFDVEDMLESLGL